MYLIAGLGNPTLKYRHTRHNVGFDAIDILAKRHGISVSKKESFSLVGLGRIGDNPVLLVKPQTFMNRSGEAIWSLLSSKGISIDKLIVLVDDINLDCGSIRIRQKGSAGGHNGLKNIIQCCGSQDFCRVRIGVGRMPEGADQVKYVLSRPKGEDLKLVKAAYENTADACEILVSGDVSGAMNKFNAKQKG